MRVEVARNSLGRLLKEDEEEIRRIVYGMAIETARTLNASFEIGAHESQLPPTGDEWRVWLLMAGRGFGKTRAGAEWIHKAAMKRPAVRIALVGASIADARSIMVEGVSGLLRVADLRCPAARILRPR